jgi:hypothetical protein
MSEIGDLVWTEGGGMRTAEETVRDFAAHFWAEPRQATHIVDGLFGIVDGLATYRIERWVGMGWKIYREHPR